MNSTLTTSEAEPATITVELDQHGEPCGYTLAFDDADQFETLDRSILMRFLRKQFERQRAP